MRIYKRGKIWYLDFTYKGKRVRKAVGHSKKIAELAMKDVEVKIAKEELLGAYIEKRVKFEDFAKEYLNFSKVNKQPRTYERDIISLKSLYPFLKEYYLSEITPKMIEQYKGKRLQVVKPATVNRELGCLRHMFNTAIRWGYIEENPLKKVKFLKEPPGRVRFLSAEEINALLSSCTPRTRSIVMVALNTGMRLSEILNLQWNDVDFFHRTITIEKSKNNKIRRIPINDLLRKELLTLPRYPKSDYVFFGKNGQHLTTIRKGFMGALHRAKIKDFRFHDLRHTFASYLVMNGANLKTGQQLLGHKDLKMTMRYSHLSKEYVQDAVEVLGKKYQEIGTNTAQQEKSNDEFVRQGLLNKQAPVAQADRAPVS